MTVISLILALFLGPLHADDENFVTITVPESVAIGNGEPDDGDDDDDE